MVEQAVDRIFKRGQSIHYTPQVARECWSVLTRPPGVGGYGRDTSGASEFLSMAGKVFVFLPDAPSIFDRWVELVTAHGVSGRQVHDAYHVAAMEVHGCDHLLTLDERDFQRYREIKPLHPRDLLSE